MIDNVPEFVREGVAWATPYASMITPEDRQRQDAIMAFVGTWEAFQTSGYGPVTNRCEVEQVGRQAELIFQAAYLTGLANF